MALIQRAHHEFKLDCQAIDSNVNLDLPKAHIDDLLYRGLLEYINVFYTGRNEQGYPLGFEVTQRRIDLLSHLVIPSDLGAGTLIGTEDGFDILEYELPENYLHFVRGYSIGACGKLSIDIVTHDDLSGALSTSSKAPSTKWGRALGVFRQGKFYLYLESADVTNTRIEYVKKPSRPFFGGYDSLEFIAGDDTAPNSGSNSTDLDIPEQWTHLVTRIAAAIYFSRISGFNKAQYLNSETLRG